MSNLISNRSERDFAESSSEESGEVSLEDANYFCRKFAQSRCENFPVVSRLLPRRFRAAFYAVYAYCRQADDWGDETGDPQKSLELLNDWENQLRRTFRRVEQKRQSNDVSTVRDEPNENFENSAASPQPVSETLHPIFVALEETVRRFELPPEPFFDLLIAFKSDQERQEFESLQELEKYCRYSANPVGRILLYLTIKKPTELQLKYSDEICSALQWANFWQDVRRDRLIGRDYIPQTIRNRYSTLPAQLNALVHLTRQKFEAGRPLLKTLPFRFRFEISLFLEAGIAVLNKIKKIDYKTDEFRPVLSRFDRFRVVWLALRKTVAF